MEAAFFFLPQRCRQFALRNHVGNLHEIRREDAVFGDRGRHGADGADCRLPALAGLQRSAEIVRLGRRERFDGKDVPGVGHDALQLVGCGHAH